MFIKQAWNKSSSGKKYVRKYLAESYRHPETGTVRHKHILNLAHVEPHIADAIEKAVNSEKPLLTTDDITTGDALRGAGLLALYRAWKHSNFDRVLRHLTDAERRSAMAMIFGRILDPSSKRAIKERLADTILAHLWPKKRLDENELYRVMDLLHEQFYDIQQRLRKEHGASATLCLYDITSTYFEGTEADDGEYGLSRDKRWDRFQIIIGLVCDQQGVPLAVEVWPGNTADQSTVIDRVQTLKEQFGIDSTVVVGDSGMYNSTNIEAIVEHGFDYIMRVEWREQRRKLRELAPRQLELFVERGVVEWNEQQTRYVGCLSEPRRQRAAARRREACRLVHQQVTHLQRTASEARRYTRDRLYQKVMNLISSAGLKDLWNIEITSLEPDKGPDEKARLELSYSIDGNAVRKRKALEGKYLLRTTTSSSEYPCEEVDGCYRSLHSVESAFRTIKSLLRIRPIYHYVHRRVRAHVLICFLAYYLVTQIEQELRQAGVTERVTSCIRRWDQLRLVQQIVNLDIEEVEGNWDWSLGERGRQIKAELTELGIWQSITAYRRSLLSS